MTLSPQFILCTDFFSLFLTIVQSSAFVFNAFHSSSYLMGGRPHVPQCLSIQLDHQLVSSVNFCFMAKQYLESYSKEWPGWFPNAEEENVYIYQICIAAHLTRSDIHMTLRQSSYTHTVRGSPKNASISPVLHCTQDFPKAFILPLFLHWH